MSDEIRLIALDIDGTLIDSNWCIPEANRQAIFQARECGVKVVLATARHYPSSISFAQQLDLDTPIICANGALIKDLEGREWWSQGVDLEWARRIAEWADTEGRAMVTLSGDHWYHAQSSTWVRQDWQPRPHDRVVDSHVAAVTVPPLFMSTIGEESSQALLDRFASQVNGKIRLDRYVNDDKLWSVMVMSAQASKESALAYLCQCWGLGAAQVLAMGDNVPDLGMLLWSGIGVVMGNAPLEVRQKMHRVAPPNDQAGVAWAIRRFVLDNEEG